MVATQGHVSQRSEEQPRPVKWNGQRGMGAGRGEEGKRLSCVLVKGAGCVSLAFTCRFSRVCYVNASHKKLQRFRVMKTHAAWEFIEKWFESNTTKTPLTKFYKKSPFRYTPLLSGHHTQVETPEQSLWADKLFKYRPLITSFHFLNRRPFKAGTSLRRTPLLSKHFFESDTFTWILI